jgi:hypothetical protein
MRTTPVLVPLLLLLSAPAVAQQATPAPTAAGPTAAIYVYPEDAGAATMAAHTADVLARRGSSLGWKASVEPRIGDLLDRTPDDLARSAESLALARTAFQEGLDGYSHLRLDQAQEALLRARAAFVDASAAPAYSDLRSLHVYLGVVALNLGQADAADASFRQALFLSPGFQLNREVFPPSVVDAYAESRRKISAGARGTMRVESDVKGALIVIDGVPKGTTPRVIADIPEGTHYLEVRAPGTLPVLQTADVQANLETPVVVSLKSTAAPLRQLWSDSRGDGGATAIARILQVDRVVLASARSTVTGVSPYAIHGAAFDGESHKRTVASEMSAARDAPTTDQRLQTFALELLRRSSGGGGTSSAAIGARRQRFMAATGTLVAIEGGAAFQDHQFDAHGHYVAADRFGNANGGSFGFDPGFKHYLETRTMLHVRYGMRENVTALVDLPFYTKSMTAIDVDGSGNLDKVKASGMGDVVAGADIRLPRFEGDYLDLAWASLRLKMPTGNSGVPGFVREYHALLLGSGQWDFYGGLGGTAAHGNGRLDFEIGYNARLPEVVDWLDGPDRHFINIGDEEHFKTDAALQLGRWLSPEVYLDFTHRHATKNFPDPISHDGDKAREMFLANLGFMLRAEFSEKSEAGFAVQHPVWGKETATFMPLDITGPRAWLWYGYRF